MVRSLKRCLIRCIAMRWVVPLVAGRLASWWSVGLCGGRQYWLLPGLWSRVASVGGLWFVCPNCRGGLEASAHQSFISAPGCFVCMILPDTASGVLLKGTQTLLNLSMRSCLILRGSRCALGLEGVSPIRLDSCPAKLFAWLLFVVLALGDLLCHASLSSTLI
jgi:hypothetical protein